MVITETHETSPKIVSNGLNITSNDYKSRL